MFQANPGVKMLLAAIALALIGTLPPDPAGAAANFRYDQLGRLITAFYDNGTCVAYAYDAAGNRISQTIALSSGSPTWGTATWGCFNWTSQ